MELFSDCSWKVHRNAKDFCVLIVYPIIPMNLFISSNSCGIFFSEFSIHGILPSMEDDVKYKQI